MKYSINDIKDKTFSELENIIQRKSFDDNFWRKHKKDPFLNQEAKLKSDIITFFDFESDVHEFSGFKDKITFFKLSFNQEKLIKIIEKLKADYFETFRFFLTKDIPEVTWNWLDDGKNNEEEGFVKFKTERLEIKKNTPFKIDKLEDYEIIGARVENLNVAIYPKNSFTKSGEKYYTIEIW